jgi:hypothetical protein
VADLDKHLMARCTSIFETSNGVISTMTCNPLPIVGKDGTTDWHVSGKPAALYPASVCVGTISSMFNRMEIGHGGDGRKTIA